MGTNLPFKNIIEVNIYMYIYNKLILFVTILKKPMTYCFYSLLPVIRYLTINNSFSHFHYYVKCYIVSHRN